MINRLETFRNHFEEVKKKKNYYMATAIAAPAFVVGTHANAYQRISLPQEKTAIVMEGKAPSQAIQLWDARSGDIFLASQTKSSPKKSLLQEKYVKQKRQVMTYDLELDRDRAKELHQASPAEYESKKQAFMSYIDFQMQTLLGERFNAGVSRFTYNVKEGELYGQNMEEPFMQTLKRGQEYRKIHGNPVDHPREEAEVIGFAKVQKVLGDEQTPAGTMMLSISPSGGEGSIYKHNFFDIFRKAEDGSIQVVRSTAGLTREEFAERVVGLSAEYHSGMIPDDSYFLSHPIQFNPAFESTSPEDIRRLLFKDHEFMDDESLQEILRICTPLITSYVNTLTENPNAIHHQGVTFNAILNKADRIANELRGYGTEGVKKNYDLVSTRYTLQEEIAYYGNQKVRAVDTGCGYSGGYEGMPVNSRFVGTVTEPISVAAFGEKKLKCTCPVCGRKVEAIIANGKISCPECNASANYEC